MEKGLTQGHQRAVHHLSRFFRLTLRDRRELAAAKPATNLAVERCLASIHSQFDALNSNHFLIYLYWLSRVLFQIGQTQGQHSPNLPTKVYLLNKALHGTELYYEVEMPSEFFCEHPLGSVMGRASYGPRFFFYQNCTVGGSYSNGILSYPQIGKNVLMYAGSAILGSSTVGNNVTLGAGTIVKDESVPSNVLVFGQSPKLIFKQQGA